MNKVNVCYTFFLSGIILFFTGCSTASVSTDQAPDPTLIFQSGFEPSSNIIRGNSDADIAGVDNSLPLKNDWVNDLDNHPGIGNFNIQYQGGDSSMRYAKIIQEPGKPSNHILYFWLNKPNVEGSKGRIQANLYNNKGMKEFYQSVRIFLPEDMRAVQKFPKKIHWLTIAEFWNNITWSQSVPYGFRITLGIGKPTPAESGLQFILDAQDCELFENGSQKYTTLWAETNEAIKVPIGKWFTMNYYYKEGDAKNGRFYLSIAPEGEAEQVVFDIHKITHNSADPAPNGVTDFNPLKLYTSKELINYMNEQGKSLEIFWDDFKLWKDKRPE